VSLVDGRHQYIHGPSPELYDLVADPAERRDLAGHERRIAAMLRGDLVARLRPPGSPQAGDAETRKRLAALGYLSGAAPPQAGPLPDPRSRLHTLDGLTAAYQHFHARSYEEAATAFAAVVRDNPRLLDAWEYYGRTLQALGRFEEALAAYETCLELSRGGPDHTLAVAAMQLELGRVERAVATVEAAQAGAARPSPEVLRDLAMRLVEQGRAIDAARILERALAARRDPATLAALGLARSAAGGHDEALALLAEAREADPGEAATHQHLSLVLLRLGRWDEARASAERALALDPALPLAWNDLGVALYRSGDPSGALAAWSRAVELDPTQHDTLYNLGTGAAAMGRRDEARRALERFVATAPPERYAADLPRARALLRSLG
jgi:tetratricopeptide (TPR) repeat protein